MNHICKECAVFQNGGCSVLKYKVNPNGNACQLFTKQLYTCAVCGSKMIQPTILNDKIICPNCSAKSGSCALCKSSAHCDFEENSSTIPKVILVQDKRGNTIMQVQKRNPEREKITCQNGCSCWSEEFGCQRDFTTCGRYELSL